jgi:hypothetical protein
MRRYTGGMRLVGALLLVLAWVSIANADTKRLRSYAGKLVISPDAPPTTAGELPAYVKANLSPDDHYELIHGPPWTCHVIAILAKPASTATLEIVDPAAGAKTAPLLSAPVTLTGDKKLVISEATLTVAAAFEANHTYAVRVVVGKKTVAKAQMRLRD